MATATKLGLRDHGHPVSLAEFEAAEFEEGYKYELIDGKLYVSHTQKRPKPVSKPGSTGNSGGIRTTRPRRSITSRTRPASSSPVASAAQSPNPTSPRTTITRRTARSAK
jgi:hypothetical protein